MAKKKVQKIELQSFDDIDFNKTPDIEAAKTIVEKPTPSIVEPKPEPVAPEKVEAPAPEPQVVAPKEAVKEEKEVKAKKVAKTKVVAAKPGPKSTFPPEDKKRASFNIDKDLHKALKDYCYYNDLQMVDYVFEELVRKDLSKKGYYPPKKRR